VWFFYKKNGFFVQALIQLMFYSNTSLDRGLGQLIFFSKPSENGRLRRGMNQKVLVPSE
jgi:hypothetical protein